MRNAGQDNPGAASFFLSAIPPIMRPKNAPKGVMTDDDVRNETRRKMGEKKLQQRSTDYLCAKIGSSDLIVVVDEEDCEGVAVDPSLPTAGNLVLDPLHDTT